jgi:Icc-related predicted phosphoesterase
MKIRVVSDLHLEHHEDHGESFIKNFPESEALVLAGDICAYQQIPHVLEQFASKAEHVIYILGNHECYGVGIDIAHSEARNAVQKLRNVHWLENNSVVIGSKTFHGCTLWFNERAPMLEPYLADFSWIDNFKNTMYDIHDRSRGYLKDNIKRGDIVVTHHAPSFNSVAPEFARSLTNGFFCNNMDSIVIEKAPAIWIHGHTHSRMDYILGETRVVCNPFGYVNHKEVVGFNINLELKT